MQTPVTIDEIYNYVSQNHPQVKWEKVVRFDEPTVVCSLGGMWVIYLTPGTFNEDYYGTGIYAISYNCDSKKAGHGLGCESFKELSKNISKDFEIHKIKIIPKDVQLQLSI